MTTSSPIISSTLTAAQRHIVDSCARGPGTYTILDLSSLSPQVFVKRGNPSLKSEACTQAYLYAQAQSSAFAFRVPKVHDVFSDGAGSTYLVMEYIAAPSFRIWMDEPDLSDAERAHRTDTAIATIADTVTVLLQCPLPEGNEIGPVGGGFIQHSFFAMTEAPIPFINAAALEKYVNKALTRRPGKPQDRVHLKSEDRLLCPSDVSLDNFLWDPVTERVWMIDFQHVNILPESFASFYFHCTTDKFVQAIAERIHLQASPQLCLLASAAYIVLQSGNSTFRLDAYGNTRHPGHS